MIAHPPLKRKHDFHKITYFLKQNAVLIVAFFAALLSSLIVPPDEKYLSYFDGSQKLLLEFMPDGKAESLGAETAALKEIIRELK